MNISKNLKKIGKIIKNINIFQPKNITKSPLLQAFISSVIQFDQSFHPVVLYEYYLIFIFININENLKMKEKHWVNLYPRG